MPCGSPRYAVLAPISKCCPPVQGRLPTRYSPVRHSCTGFPAEAFLPVHPFDLHVLGTPPAFILSQDQTLMFILRLAASYATASSAAGFLFLYCFWVRGIPATASSEFPLALFRAFTDFQGCIAVHLPRFVCISGISSRNTFRLYFFYKNGTEKEGFEPSRRY